MFIPGGLPRAWSTPSLGPYVRSGLKPPLLQQAAFDDLVFRVDVMRNVASRHLQDQDQPDEELPKITETSKWNSLPILNLLDIQDLKSQNPEEIDETNENDEGLQEVAGKLEIRVVPKENVPKMEEKPIVKLERTKSILKQSSKERNEGQEIHSPKREQITFAPEVDEDEKMKKRVSLETEEIQIKEPENEEKKSESSTSETEQKNSEKKPEIVNNCQRATLKPIEKLKNNLVSASESSSSTGDKLEQNLKNVRNSIEKKNLEVKERVQCSPSVDLTTNPAVTFVSAASEPTK